MRLVALSSWWPSPPTNGSKLRAWHLLEELARRHEITLLSFAEDDEAQADAVAALRAFCADVRVVPGNPHKPSRRLSWRGYFGGMPRSYAQTFSRRMSAYVVDAATRADALIAFQIGTALYFNRIHRVPRIFDEADASVIRDGITRRGTIERLRQRATWRKYASFTRHLVDASSHTTVVSEAERRCLGEVGCDTSRIAVLPNGVARAFLDVSEPKQPDTLVYPGAVTYGPNLDAVRFFVERVFPVVRSTCPGVTLTVTGRHDGAPIAGLARDGVRFTGQLPDVRSTIARSEICVVPLRQGGGTRLKILEAMALGTPVVSTVKGAEGLDVRDGEHLLIADHPEAFARSVVALLRDRGRARAMAESARQLIAGHYTWDRVGQQLEQVIQRAVDIEQRRRS